MQRQGAVDMWTELDMQSSERQTWQVETKSKVRGLAQLGWSTDQTIGTHGQQAVEAGYEPMPETWKVKPRY